jgi:hypothetical protein
MQCIWARGGGADRKVFYSLNKVQVKRQRIMEVVLERV